MTSDTVEGTTPIGAIPTGTIGPGTKDKEAPFYNPAMALNRDLSLLLIAAEAKRRGRDLDIADPLCGAGARSLRIANEIDHPLTVYANDLRPDAIAHLQASAQRLDIADRISTTRSDALAFLASRRFDVIDIDPYGSPMPFVDAAIAATRHDGLLCVTATDTAALCGTYPKPCRRRYGAEHRLHRAPWRAEVGLRILAAAVIQAAGRHEKAATPILSVTKGHWMRVVVRVSERRQEEDRLQRLLGYAWADERGGGQWARNHPGIEFAAGPLWGGPLHDAETVAAMVAASEARKAPLAAQDKVDKLLPILTSEADPDAPPFWVDLDLFAGKRHIQTPRTEQMRTYLESEGVPTWRAQNAPKAIRTHASESFLAEACSRLTAKAL